MNINLWSISCQVICLRKQLRYVFILSTLTSSPIFYSRILLNTLWRIVQHSRKELSFPKQSIRKGRWKSKNYFLSVLHINDCLIQTIGESKGTNDMSLHSQKHHGLNERRPITSRLNQPIRSITRVKYHQLMCYNSLWLWRWQPHRLSKCQSQATTVLFGTTFTQMITHSTYLFYPFLTSKLSQDGPSFLSFQFKTP